MKKKDRYSLINHAIDDYNKTFGHDYKTCYMTRDYIKKLLKEYKHSRMCYWSYCCYGLYKNCWEDPVADGIWGMDQSAVDRTILDVFRPDVLKACRRDKRMVCFESEGEVHVVIIARDLPNHLDYLITFTNKE